MGNLTVKESGEMASFISPNVSKITSFKVHFSPRQEGSGDPSPENVREITGWNGVEGYGCGKNLVPWIKTNLTVQGDRYNGFANWSELWEIPKRISYTYSVFIDNSNCSTAGSARVWLRDIDNSKYTHVVTGTEIKAGEKGISTVTLNFSNLPNDYYAYWGLNLYQNAIASMPIVYESDQETVIISDWSSNIGTVYGGYVDLTSGELVQTIKRVEFTWGDCEDSTILGNTERRYIMFNDNRFKTIDSLKTKISNIFSTFLDNSSWNVDKVSCAFGNKTIICKLPVGSDNNTIIQVAGDLATPITHQLTPQQLSTLKGQNNFWSNADYIEIEYELTETFDIQKAKRKIILNQPHVESASGDLVTFDTDMKGKLKECKVYFSPVQEGEGDPSPDNVRNITGWNRVRVTQTNQNLIRADNPNNPALNYYARSSYNYVVYSEEEQAFTERNVIEHVGGGINEANHARINATKNDQARLFIAPKDGIYTFTCDYKNVGTTYGLRFYKIIDGVSTRLGDIHGDADGLWHTRSFTVELNKGDSFRLYIYSNMYWRNFRIIEGDGTDYTENVTNDYSISWTDSVGTIYGGYVDLVSGELVQTWKTVNSEDLTWSVVNSTRICAYGDKDFKVPEYTSVAGELIGEQMYVVPQTRNLTNYPNGVCIMSSGCLYKYFDGTNYPQGKISYKLATPITHQLTPQQILALKGINNVYSNTNGQTEIKYWKH